MGAVSWVSLVSLQQGPTELKGLEPARPHLTLCTQLRQTWWFAYSPAVAAGSARPQRLARSSSLRLILTLGMAFPWE